MPFDEDEGNYVPRKSDSEKIEEVKRIINDGNPRLIDALRELVMFAPTFKYPLREVSVAVHGDDAYYDGDRADDIRDEDCPFFSEAFLYNLFGKEDARSLLASLHEVLEAAGLPRRMENDWHHEFFEAVKQKKATEKKEIERIERMNKLLAERERNKNK